MTYSTDQAQLPFYGNISGLWPGLWTMGNLGRPGYMATTEGVWPYTYEECDAGITANQSSPDGEDHPNQGTGRGAPEIDILEGEIDTTKYQGIASQSYQIAPMDIWYYPDYNFVEIYDPDITTMNTYTGGPNQQAVSGTTTLNTKWYEGEGYFQQYGFEWLSHDKDGYLTWYVGEPTLTVQAQALAPNGNVGWRRLSKEPMSIVMNLGISNNWAYIDWNALQFPATMSVDHVRIYQPEDEINVTCDPEDHPTSDYIENHANAYQNVNLTSWEDAGYKFPKNKLVHKC
ncbi:beta-glucan synthesis-associated protein [Cerrena zonata]|uniref:Beta-glucan synthesis-associated protein n=1 Tax=Cerrena zonata TaxID=2478898 RepID=A0AAW0FDS8_9APHY